MSIDGHIAAESVLSFSFNIVRADLVRVGSVCIPPRPFGLGDATPRLESPVVAVKFAAINRPLFPVEDGGAMVGCLRLLAGTAVRAESLAVRGLAVESLAVLLSELGSSEDVPSLLHLPRVFRFLGRFGVFRGFRAEVFRRASAALSFAGTESPDGTVTSSVGRAVGISEAGRCGACMEWWRPRRWVGGAAQDGRASALFKECGSGICDFAVVL